MAQKQFKIGLSNTDKQNMAQDVYERVLALTFNEYDTTTEYEVGDFVVYNDQLYKCISATSGAWDSSKWQLATLNDLVDDIENAVAFVNDKANVNGNYPTMTVGFADNLTPYDESSGDDQDEPFSFQATGTGNGTQPDFATGSGALMKEKQGNTVVVNQGVSTPSFSRTVEPDYTQTNSSAFYPNGHKILVLGTIKTNKFTFHCNIFNGAENVDGYPFINGAGNFAHVFNNNYGASIQFNFYAVNVTETANYEGEVYTVDLTQWFGSNDNIPVHLLSHPEDFFRYYQGSLAYNEGTLVNSNGRYLKTIGRNQWDEETKLGYYSTSDGEYVSNNNYLCSVNKCRCIPNTKLFVRLPTQTNTSDTNLLFYDANNNYVGHATAYGLNPATIIIDVPANACWFNLYITDLYGTTYNHDITISIYYEDESGYDQYYPYELLTNNDTGTEVLRSAGSVKDSKAPDGTITRRIGYVDLSTLSWHYDSNNGYFIAEVSGIKQISSPTLLSNISCNKYMTVKQTEWSLYDKVITLLQTSNVILIHDTSLNGDTSAISGTLYYELAEPTTEQGTPYSENVAIDDFGSMDFGGTNGVPQGNLIFYPVDYKAFIDTLHKYTDGTPSKIALKSDLASDKSELQGVDTQLLNAVGGTLRQCLCIKETLDFDNTNVIDLGDLAWVYSNGIFIVSIPADGKPHFDDTNPADVICTKYKIVARDDTESTDKAISWKTEIRVNDSAYTDATTFKNAMKGVLLAYEKASS